MHTYNRFEVIAGVHSIQSYIHTYRFLVWEEGGLEHLQLLPLEQLLLQHLGQHHRVRAVLGQLIQTRKPLVLRGVCMYVCERVCMYYVNMILNN